MTSKPDAERVLGSSGPGGEKDGVPVRLFIAALLPPALRQVLLQSGRLLQKEARSLSPCRADQMHLTLRFIGDTSKQRAQDLTRWFSSLVLMEEDRRFAHTGYGSFSGQDGLTLWAGLCCSQGMARFRADLESGLRALGCGADTRPWLPHVTLARRAHLMTPLEELTPRLPRAQGTLVFGDIVLFESKCTPLGVRHIPLAQLEHPFSG